MKRILLATNGSGYQIDKCLELSFFKDSVTLVVTDRECPAIEVAEKHGVMFENLREKDSECLNAKILELASAHEIDYIISPGFTRLFRPSLIDAYRERIFNCHPSILPAFPGYYDTRDTRRNIHARKIFERTIEFGSRVTGNTIHVVNEHVDDGFPIIVSTMNIPPDEDPRLTRHRLFLHECKTLLQVVLWLNEERLLFDGEGRPFVANATFTEPGFSPNLDEPQIAEFVLPYPWQ